MKAFSDDLEYIKQKSGSMAFSFYHTWVGTPHVFMTVMSFLKANMAVDRYKPVFEKLKGIMEEFEITGKDFKDAFIEVSGKGVPPIEGEKWHLKTHKNVQEVFDSLGRQAVKEGRTIEIEDLIRELFADRVYKIYAILDYFFESSATADDFRKAVINAFKAPVKQEVKKLEKIAELTNLNKYVSEKDPIYIGGDMAIKAIEMGLAGRSIRNVMLKGRAGVGKTALMYELVKRVIAGEVNSSLQGKLFYQLDPGALVAGTRFRGDMEEKLMNILDLCKANPHVILFVDEAHMMVKLGDSDGAASAGNIIKPYITRGDVQLIMATTDDEYAQHIEKDRAFARRFHNVNVGEPTLEETERILKGLQPHVREFFEREDADELMKKVLILSDKYNIDQANPAKAINMYELAFAESKVFNEEGKIVFNENVLNAIKIKYDLHLEEDRTNATAKELKSFLLGQDEPLDQVIKHLRYIENDLVNPEKPLASFILAGPTGVGKTETAKIIAKKFFGSEKHLIKINMGEYGSEMDVSKITGSAPGYIGSDQQSGLVSLVKQYPSSIILFDEVEKAHPKVFDTILNILDTGEMTDNQKNRVSFRNCVIAFTTNLGYSADFAKSKGVGFHKTRTTSDDINETIKEYFRPEFINRIDDIIVYNGLDNRVAETLINRYVKDYEDRAEISVTLQPYDYTDITKDADIKTYGARSLERSVKRQLLTILERSQPADLSAYKLADLKNIAKGLDMKGYTGLNKSDLLEILADEKLDEETVKRLLFVNEEGFDNF